MGRGVCVCLSTWIELREGREGQTGTNESYEVATIRRKDWAFVRTWWWDGNGVYLERVDVMCRSTRWPS